MSEVNLNEDKRQSDEGRPHRTGGGHPSDRVRAAFASAIESLKADMGADGANESEIATSLKSKIREILNEEISKKHQASSVLTAASALTSLCDMSDRSSNDGEGDDVEDNEFTCDEKTKQKEEAKQDKKSTSNRDDIPMSFPQKVRLRKTAKVPHSVWPLWRLFSDTCLFISQNCPLSSKCACMVTYIILFAFCGSRYILVTLCSLFFTSYTQNFFFVAIYSWWKF